MELAGLVTVQVQADTTKYERGLERAAMKGRSAGDSVVGSFRRAQKEQERFGSAATRAASRAQSAFKGVTDQLSATSKMTSGLTASFKNFAVGAAAAFSAGAVLSTLGSFSDEMQAVRAVTGATDKQFRAMRETAKQLGRETLHSATQAASGLKFLGQAGFTADQATAALPATLELATAGALGLGEAADIASNVLSAYQMDAAETAKITNVLAKAASSSNTDVRQLGEAFAYVAPLTSNLNISVADAAAAIGVLSDAGIQGGKAGTSLQRVISRLINPTGEAKTAIENLVGSVDKVDPSVNSLTTVVDRLAKANLNAKDAAVIFGEEGLKSILALTGSSERLQELTDKTNNAAGAAKEMADVMAQGVGANIKLVVSAVEGLIQELGDAGLNAVIITVAQSISKIFNGMTTVVSYVTSAVDGIVGPAFSALGIMVDRVSTAVAVLAGVLATGFAVKSAGLVVGAVSAMASGMFGLTKAAFALVGGFKAVRVASMLLMASPVGAFLATVAAATYVVVQAFGGWEKAWDSVKQAGQRVVDWFTETFPRITKAVQELLAIFDVFGGVEGGELEVKVTKDKSLDEFLSGLKEESQDAADKFNEGITDGGETAAESLSEAVAKGGETAGKTVDASMESGGQKAGKAVGGSMESAGEVAGALVATSFKAAGVELSQAMANELKAAGYNVGKIIASAIYAQIQQVKAETEKMLAEADAIRRDSRANERLITAQINAMNGSSGGTSFGGGSGGGNNFGGSSFGGGSGSAAAAINDNKPPWWIEPKGIDGKPIKPANANAPVSVGSSTGYMPSKGGAAALPPSAMNTPSITIVNVEDEEKVLKALNSEAGTEVVLNLMNANNRKFKQVLGI